MLAKEDRLGDIRINIYTILTQSMYPTIKAGDVVVTSRQDGDKYNKGDIITFVSDMNGGITITHRVEDVYKINDSYSYRTKGDNNNTADNEIVPGSSVFGRVVLKIPKIGYIQQFLSSMVGWIVVIVIPCLGIIIYDILKVIKSLFGADNTSKRKDSKRVMEARQALREAFEEDVVEDKDVDNSLEKKGSQKEEDDTFGEYTNKDKEENKKEYVSLDNSSTEEDEEFIDEESNAKDESSSFEGKDASEDKGVTDDEGKE